MKICKNIVNNTRIFLAVIILVMCTILIPVQKSEAAIPTIRMDLHINEMILAVQTEIQTWMKDILTNLDDVKAIMDLANQIKSIKSMIEDFNVQSLIDSLTGDILNSFMSDFSKQLNTADIGTGMQTGKFEGKQLENNELDLLKTLQNGGVNAAASSVVNRAKRIIEETFDLPATDGPEAGKAKETKSTGDEKKDAAVEAAKSAMIMMKEVAPMSFAGMQETAAAIGGSSNLTPTDKQKYALNIGEDSKQDAIAQIAKIVAPYTAPEDSEASYKYGINKIREQSQKAMEKAAEHSEGGPSTALKTIAGLSAVMVEQQSLQNELLVSLTNVLADDIKMTGVAALLELESYSNNVQQNTIRYIDIYNAMGQ